MSDNYEYPLLPGLSVDEITSMINFFQQVEKAYEQKAGVKKADFELALKQFMNIVPSKMEQKQLETKFKDESGYDAYRVIKALRDSKTEYIKVSDE
ncbi:UPF0223 family protein [Lentilactobacillus sp. Marseille-Q4993]|uniref:UPF0223 family protein n=1 Tax=Lentilactobacillus sp. Marseille-Q4993 TaxID=3039492 RepID=UPI0024BC084D|nr:UPF0223 family protein [Lentilactobacillus sp. Marseille-Q4993]